MNIQLGPIALFGTSADPPTNGHKALLEGLLNLFPIVATWASDNPMKKHGASLEKRHLLLKTIVHDINNPNLLIIQELSSPWSINTLTKAKNLWPDRELIFVVGSDLTSQIPHWFQAQSFLKKIRLGIAPREGWPIKKQYLKKLEDLGGKVDLLPLTIPNTASSYIRNNSECSQIPEVLLSILINNKLYGFDSNQ